MHPSVIQEGNQLDIAKIHRKILWYATNYNDDDLRQLTVRLGGKVGAEHIYSYPYLKSKDEDDSESSQEGTSPRKPKRVRTMRRPKHCVRRRIRVRRLVRELRAESHLPSSTLFTLTLTDNDNCQYVAVSRVHKQKVYVRRLKGSELDSSFPPTLVSFKPFAIEGVPSMLHPSGKVSIGKCRRTGGKGSFHMKFGYIADDEAPAAMVESGAFDSADLREWESIMSNDVIGKEVTDVGDNRVCRTRFRRTLKTSAQMEVVHKSRFLVCETNDPRDVESNTEMPHPWMRRMMLVIGLSHGWTAATIDVKTAFL